MPYLLCNEVVRDLEFAAQCDLAARLGFDGIELAPFTLGPEPHRLPPERVAAVRHAVADAGLRVGALHWLLVAPEGLSITSADAGVRRATLDVIDGLVTLAAELGARVLVHGSPKQRTLPTGDERTGAIERAKEAFALAGRAAEGAGVTYCIEPLSAQETEFVTGVAEAVAIVDEIGSPALRTMIDCRAARLSEVDAVEDLIARYVPSGHVCHVHVNDRNSGAPGAGDDVFTPVVAALRAVGYRGDVGVEPFVYEPDGPTSAARAIGYLRGIEEALDRR